MTASIGVPLLMHGEVVDKEIDVFDREAVFIDRYLTKIREAFPELRMVMEHITTRDAAQFVTQPRHQYWRHHHPPAPDDESQRHLGRWYQTPQLLPADPEAQYPSAGATRSSHKW